MPRWWPLRCIVMPPPSAHGTLHSSLARRTQQACDTSLITTWGMLWMPSYCCCLQVRGQTMTSLMAYGSRFLTRSALTRLTSFWETRHISLLTETVNNVSKIDVYIHKDASLCVSNGKQDCSLTGSQQTGPTRGYRQCWQPHMSTQASALPEVEARHLITEHIKQCCFIPTESRWWRVGREQDERRRFTLRWDHTSQIVAASALITHLWVHKQRPALAPLRVSEAEGNMQIRRPLNDLTVNQETEGRAGSKWGLFLLFFLKWALLPLLGWWGNSHAVWLNLQQWGLCGEELIGHDRINTL